LTTKSLIPIIDTKMPSSQTPTRRSIEWWAIHAVWGCLAAVHGGVLAQNIVRQVLTGWSWTGLGVALALLVTSAFFVLKTMDVRFLRFRCNRTALVAFIVCSAIAHGDIVTEAGNATAIQAVTWIAVVGCGVAAVASLQRLNRRLPNLLKGLCESIRAFLVPGSKVVCVLASEPCRPQMLRTRSVTPPRGPPM
jgi:hypothetical protein